MTLFAFTFIIVVAFISEFLINAILIDIFSDLFTFALDVIRFCVFLFIHFSRTPFHLTHIFYSLHSLGFIAQIIVVNAIVFEIIFDFVDVN